MARRKKVVEETFEGNIALEEPTEIKEDFMNPPVEEEVISTPVIKEEIKKEEKIEVRPLKKVLKFTPVGPKIEYI